MIKIKIDIKTIKGGDMSYDTQHWQDQYIDEVFRFLFEYAPPEMKFKRYQHIAQIFQQLDLSAQYFLFTLIQERLPQRAKYLFLAEDYQGKQQVVLEVMQQLVHVR